MSDEPPAEDQAGWAAPAPTPRPTPAPAPAPAPGAVASLLGAMTAGTRPPRKRRGWIVALVAALGAIVALSIAGTVLFVDRTLPPYQGAYDFLSDVTAGRENAATAGLCKADRSNPEAALGVLGRQIAVGSTVHVNFLDVSRDGDRADVDFLVEPRGSTTSTTFELPMREEDGDWKACPGASLR